jgi:hypothetical protein
VLNKKAYFGHVLGNKHIILYEKEGSRHKHVFIAYSIGSKTWYRISANSFPEKGDFVPSTEDLKLSIKLLFEKGIGI